jgi:hypothetical protein
LSSGERDFLQSNEPLLFQVARGLPFDRVFWTHLVGEILTYSAVEMPEIPLAPATLCGLLNPARDLERTRERVRMTPIEQVHYGSRDLILGAGFYRPDQVGWNDNDDVQRLAGFLAALKPDRWKATDLPVLDEAVSEEERAEELEFICEWFPALREFYQRAHTEQHIVVCEEL